MHTQTGVVGVGVARELHRVERRLVGVDVDERDTGRVINGQKSIFQPASSTLSMHLPIHGIGAQRADQSSRV